MLKGQCQIASFFCRSLLQMDQMQETFLMENNSQGIQTTFSNSQMEDCEASKITHNIHQLIQPSPLSG